MFRENWLWNFRNRKRILYKYLFSHGEISTQVNSICVDPLTCLFYAVIENVHKRIVDHRGNLIEIDVSTCYRFSYSCSFRFSGFFQIPFPLRERDPFDELRTE